MRHDKLKKECFKGMETKDPNGS
jgi:hypothetical protein